MGHRRVGLKLGVVRILDALEAQVLPWVVVQKRLFPLLIQLAVEEPLSKQLLVVVESKVTEKVIRTHHRRTGLENRKTSF
jgi:hypothetical protein